MSWQSFTEVRDDMSEQRQDTSGQGKSQRRPQKRTMDNATKRLFMSVLIIMCGALLSMTPQMKIVGYIIAGVGVVWYLFLRFLSLRQDWRAKHGQG